MIIANPVYDVVFKRLMENEKVAKFFIGTLLNAYIETIIINPQEFTHDHESGIAIFRLDFLATIKLDDGTYKKVLIEIQKARHPIDLMRFRNYLGEQYKKEDIIENKKQVLPITTIYILGFKLDEISSPCIKVERNYNDLINNTIIEKRSHFIESLSHDCYIVQTGRITNRYQTKIEKLLSLFEQNNFVDDSHTTKEFLHQIENEDIKIATEILHHAGTDPKERKQIENEREAWRTINVFLEEALGLADDALRKYEIVQAQKEIVESQKEVLASEKEVLASEKEVLATENEILKQKIRDMENQIKHKKE